MTGRRAAGPGSASLQRAFASAHGAQGMGRGAGEAHRAGIIGDQAIARPRPQ